MTQSDSIVIIPTYNEKENIEKIIRAVFGLEKAFHILVIEDAAWVPLFHMEHVFGMNPRVNRDTFTPYWAGWSSMGFYGLDFK